MGLYGIRIKIAYKNAVPLDFEMIDNAPQEEESEADG